jgi:very-short-patch-repair endonuclease
VTAVEQTLLDVARSLSRDELELAFDSALRLGLTRFDRIKRFFDTFAGGGVPGTTALSEILRLREPCPRPHHSILEVGFRQLTRNQELPGAVSQFPVELPTGVTVHLDFAYPDEKLAIEVDSVRWHSGLRAIRWDNERQNLLVALGWRVLRFEWNDVVHKPAMVAAQIMEALIYQQRV